MKIVALEPAMYDYLLHVFEGHARAGLASGELVLAAATFQRLAAATDVALDDKGLHLGQARVASMGPNGVALEIEPAPEPGAAQAGGAGVPGVE